jgi:hypothetical protein
MRCSPLIWVLWVGMSAGCSSEPVVQATVRDVWGHLIPGAVIRVGTDQLVTGDDGRVDLPVWTGEKTIHVGRKGYIPQSVSHAIPAGSDASIPGLDVSLYRKPDPRDELFIVGHKDYVRLDPRSVERKIVDPAIDDEYIGLRLPPTSRIAKAPSTRTVELVWASTNELSVVKQKKPRIRKLEYVDSVECSGASQMMSCEVGLHLPGEGEPLGRVELLGTEHEYYFHVYRVELPVEKGNYALYFDELFETTGNDFRDLSKELRQAYPFQVR